MILRDEVTVLRRVQAGDYDAYGNLADPPGSGCCDIYGNDVYDDVEQPYPAEVRPLGSAETVGDRTTVQTRYRLFLPAAAAALSPSDAVTWRGKTLELQGDVEPHTLGRSLHHVEVIAARVSG